MRGQIGKIKKNLNLKEFLVGQPKINLTGSNTAIFHFFPDPSQRLKHPNCRQNDTFLAAKFGWAPTNAKKLQTEIYVNGSVAAGFTMYDDFRGYESGKFGLNIINIIIDNQDNISFFWRNRYIEGFFAETCCNLPPKQLSKSLPKGR